MYNSDHIARFYDDYDEREWERVVLDPAQRVSFEVHRRMLDKYIKAGDRVLEAGSGPGRFTIELARIGARIVVADISSEQLRLHRDKTVEIEAVIEERVVVESSTSPVLAMASSTRSSASAGRSRTCSNGRTTPSPSCSGSHAAFDQGSTAAARFGHRADALVPKGSSLRQPADPSHVGIPYEGSDSGSGPPI